MHCSHPCHKIIRGIRKPDTLPGYQNVFNLGSYSRAQEIVGKAGGN